MAAITAVPTRGASSLGGVVRARLRRRRPDGGAGCKDAHAVWRTSTDRRWLRRSLFVAATRRRSSARTDSQNATSARRRLVPRGPTTRDAAKAHPGGTQLSGRHADPHGTAPISASPRVGHAESIARVPPLQKMPVCRHFACRRRDSNPRQADYDCWTARCSPRDLAGFSWSELRVDEPSAAEVRTLEKSADLAVRGTT